jgi:uncharacterized protein YbjQ (UPF0145 family)
MLSNCKTLGNVTGEDIENHRSWSLTKSEEDGRQQAINTMRDNAFKQYNADSVALINIDEIIERFVSVKYIAQGVAFKCNLN